MTADPKRTTLGIAFTFELDCTVPPGSPHKEAKPQPVNHSDLRHIKAAC